MTTNMIPTIPEARERPLVELLKIAAPTVAAMTSYTIMQFVDKLMVSRIGPDPIYVGAQGNGGLAAFVPIAVVMGFLTVVNTYVSQNLGAGRPERAPAYAWNGLWIAVIAWLLLIPYGMALPRLFAALGHDALRIELESGYGRILIFGSILTMATRGISQYFYGMHKPGVVLLAGLTGNLVNFVLNWVLVFGNLGAPALGIEGSAIATVIGTAVELSIPLCIFLGPANNAKYATRAAWRPSAKHLREIAKIGWPGGAMFGNEMICWWFFMVYFVGGFGEEHSTAGWIAHQYMSLSFMPTVGIGVAITAMVGKCMGMGRPDLAAQRARMGMGLAIAYMSACGVLFYAFRNQLVAFFIEDGTDPEVASRLVSRGSTFLVATAAFQFFDAIAMTASSALRGAGDTVFSGVATLILSWGVIVGGGYLMVTKFPQLESLGPWIAAAVYITLLSVAILGRYLSGKWKTIKLVEKGEAGVADAAQVETA